MWSCQTCTKGSVVAQFKPVYLPLCTFCSADMWPGALDEFPEVSPPRPAAAADEAGNGGGMVPWPEHSAPDEPDKDDNNEQVPDSGGSSPDQVEVKTLSKQYRRDWKP